MPVVIVGSGRCGTSMVTRMLNLCGLQIGRVSDMHDSADHNNLTGYWEHRGFRQINEDLLAHFNGTELVPPQLPNNWQFDPAIDPFVVRAQQLINKFASLDGKWGWKDPRTSLTLPFWQRLIPDLKVVLCVRNPLEVVRSFEDLLEGYGTIGSHLGVNQGLLNWYKFNAEVIANTGVDSRVITHYEDYFPLFADALNSVLRFLDMPIPFAGSAVRRRLDALHDPGLKHHSKTLEDLLENQAVPEAVKELYSEMLNARLDGADAEIRLQAAASMPSTPLFDISHWDQVKLEEIVRNYVLLESHRRQTDDILSSRTHMIAAKVCTFLIWRKSVLSRMRTQAADKINDVIAIIDNHNRIRPMRWY